ncbi:hypothetical protein ACVWWG_003778 [Bradyrhizobium sp. LB7.2]
MVTSVNRLVAVGPHSAANVEAPDPDTIMRRGDPGKDHDPSYDINPTPLKPPTTSIANPARQSSRHPRSLRLRDLTSSDGAVATGVSLERERMVA